MNVYAQINCMDLDTVRHNLTGPLASIRVPFDREGAIDDTGLRRYIDASIEGGSRSIILTAGNSHYHCLSDEEILHVTRLTCEQTAKQAMVVAADRFHATTRAIAFAREVKALGADILMCMPPPWGGSGPEEMAEHYAAVAKVMPVMIVTNVFHNLPVTFGLDTIRLALDNSDRILAVKDDIGGTFAPRMCAEFHDRMAIFAGGAKENHLKLLPFGCDGYMSMFVTFNPPHATRYWQAVTTGDRATMHEIVFAYDAPLFGFMSGFASSCNAGQHGLIELYGIAKRWRRKPHASASDEELDRLAGFLAKRGLL